MAIADGLALRLCTDGKVHRFPLNMPPPLCGHASFAASQLWNGVVDHHAQHCLDCLKKQADMEKAG